MDILKNKDIKALIDISGEVCVSLYMPTHRTGRQQQQDPIRFRNLVNETKKKLCEIGFRQPDAEKFLYLLNSYFSAGDFWQHQSDGLAVFLSTNFSRTYRLPSSFDELLVISKYFHIKPLLPLLSQDGQFYILAISMNEIRLFWGTREMIDAVDLGDMSTNMQEVLWMDDPEVHLDFHTSASSSGRESLRTAREKQQATM